jgi:monofunctional biosynthetic peptidoglycan transglycosylase
MAATKGRKAPKPAKKERQTRAAPSRPWLRRLLVGVPLALVLFVGVEYLRLPSTAQIAELAKTTPTQSAMMRHRVEQAKDDGKELKLRHKYVPLAQISPNLQRAVILSEDQKFWMHDGIDWGETRVAVAQAFEEGRLGRGGSTLTQQLAKNLFLSEDRSVLRKMKEWVLASRLEDALTKKRILELYLNFAEWGEGVFGAEAAARAHFSTSAANLDVGEAAVLVAMLPAPRKRDPGHPSRNLRRRAYKVADLMSSVGLARRGELRSRLNDLVGPDVPPKGASKAADSE